MVRILGTSDEDLARIKFIPTAGPQREAYYSKADILLFGGSAGCGKSGLICGLALQEHKRSLIIRRQYADMSGLIDDLLKFNGSRDGFTQSPRPKLVTDEVKIEFGALQNPGDEYNFQGSPKDLLCVGKGTLIQVGKNKYKPIEDLQIGDQVMTLEGLRKVQRVFPRQIKHSVLIEALSDSGEVVASQIQSESHNVLATSGWVCYDKKSLPPLSFDLQEVSNLFGALYKSANMTTSLCQDVLQQLSLYTYLTPPIFLRHLLSHQKSLMEIFFGREGTNHDNIFLGCSDLLSNNVQRVLCRRNLPISFLQPRLENSLSLLFPLVYENGDADVQSLSLLQGFLLRCLIYSHLYDGRTQQLSDLCFEPKDDQLYLHLSSDAGKPSPKSLKGGAQGKTPKYTHQTLQYTHPYKMDKRLSSLGVSCFSYRITPVGIKEVYDIQVEEVNHFISKGGFVNQNCFDEASQLKEAQVRFVMGWLRSTEPGQRCRVVFATNPPVSSDGDWLISMFAAWLDPNHPNPAKHGELRWYITDQYGKDEEVPSGELIERDGRTYRPMSRTFIPGKLADNPYLRDTNYAATLDAMPEPYRSAMRDGNFALARQDGMKQLIPSEWVRAAMARWVAVKGYKPDGIPMTAMGVDCGGGGKDATVIACRYDYFYDTLIKVAGTETKNSQGIAAQILVHRKDNCEVILDMGGGYGGEPYTLLRENIPHNKVIAYKGAENSTARTKDRTLTFANKRAAVYWAFREALDPSQPGGSPIMLPDDRELLAELTAVNFEVITKGIKAEPKDKVIEKLGRSPDKADATVMAWFAGAKGVEAARVWGVKDFGRKRSDIVVGYSNRKKRR